jgi:hypothetical protein
MLLGHGVQARLEWLGGIHKRSVILVLGAPDRDIAADLAEHLPERFFVQIITRDRKPAGHHAAADINAHGGWDNGLVSGDYGTNSGTDTEMHVRHGGDVVMDEGQTGDIGQLPLRFLIDIVSPDFDWNALRGQNFLDRHCSLQK